MKVPPPEYTTLHVCVECGMTKTGDERAGHDSPNDVDRVARRYCHNYKAHGDRRGHLMQPVSYRREFPA